MQQLKVQDDSSLQNDVFQNNDCRNEEENDFLKERVKILQTAKEPFLELKYVINKLIFQILRCFDLEILAVKALRNERAIRTNKLNQVLDKDSIQFKFQQKLLQYKFPVMNSMSRLYQKVVNFKEGNPKELIQDQKPKPVQIKGNQQSVQQIKDFVIYQNISVKKEVRNCLVLSMNQNQIIYGNNNELNICHTAGEPIVKYQTNSIIECLHFSKQGQWLIYGTKETLKLMEINQCKELICLQDFKSCANLIVMNEDENQFISSHCSEIEFWIKEQKWNLNQKIKLENAKINSISANFNFSNLAACGKKLLKIWQKEDNNTWLEKQSWSKPKLCSFSQVCFTENYELVATTFQGYLLIFLLNQNQYQLQDNIKLNKSQKNIQRFPILYNKELKIMILRHIDQVFILKKQNEKYSICQVIIGDYKAAYVNSFCLILSNEGKLKQIEIWKQQN